MHSLQQSTKKTQQDPLLSSLFIDSKQVKAHKSYSKALLKILEFKKT